MLSVINYSFYHLNSYIELLSKKLIETQGYNTTDVNFVKVCNTINLILFKS